MTGNHGQVFRHFGNEGAHKCGIVSLKLKDFYYEYIADMCPITEEHYTTVSFGIMVSTAKAQVVSGLGLDRA